MLFTVFGSGALLDTLAVGVSVPETPRPTATVSVNSTEPRGARLPRAQVTALPNAVQVAPLAETRLMPAGRAIRTTTCVAVDGPAYPHRGAHVVVVVALRQEVAPFYEGLGFQRLPDSLFLVLKLSDIEATLPEG